MVKIAERKNGLAFKVHVQPRSSKEMISGLYGDALKVRLKAPPVDNAANKACVKFIAKTLSVSKSFVSIISGHTSRAKQVLVLCDRLSEKEIAALKKKISSLAKS